MSTYVIERLLLVSLIFGPLIIAVGGFRLNSLHTSADNRKAALRDQIKKLPPLLIVVQHVGKFAGRELAIFRTLHPVYEGYVREIYSIRATYTRRVNAMAIALTIWAAACLSPAWYAASQLKATAFTPVLAVTLVSVFACMLLVFSLRLRQADSRDTSRLARLLDIVAADLGAYGEQEG